MSKYVVFDLEMCKVPAYFRKNGFGLSCEIIQIGAVAVNESFEITDTFATFVKPQHGIIDAFIKDLTGISQSQLKDAPTTEEALKMFLDWIPDGAVLVAWSQNDERQITRELEVKGIELSVLVSYLEGCVDCQEIFSDKMNTEKKYRLSEALSIADIDYDENIHDALVDSRNTALLFAKTQLEDVLVLSPYLVTDTSESPFGGFSRYCIA